MGTEWGTRVKPQRRVFLKVLASAPLGACAGAADDGSLPSGGAGVGSGSTSAGSASVGGRASGGAASAGGSFGVGGDPFASGGSSSGGNPFGSGGSSSGGNPFGSGGSSTGVAGTSASAGTTSSGTAGTTSSSNPGMVVGNVTEFPLGSFNIAGGLYFVGHDANGLFAMSMQCTHKGCTVGFSGNDLLCPCHGARFTRDGSVVNGPATEPLPHLALYVDAAGNVSVDKYTVVAASARTKV